MADCPFLTKCERGEFGCLAGESTMLAKSDRKPVRHPSCTMGELATNGCKTTKKISSNMKL